MTAPTGPTGQNGPGEEPGATTPSVSFLCTAYRTEDTVVRTIESVLAQTRTDWQLVLVDNGPSDEMVAVVAPYTSDPRFVLVRQDNARAAGGVNAAARVATGRYVSVLHTDDLVVPTFLERLVPELDARPDVALLACDAHFLTDQGLRPRTWRDPVPAEYRQGGPVTIQQLMDLWLPYYTGLVRKEAWDEVGGFRTDAPSVEDLAFYLDLMSKGHALAVLEEPLAVYREEENSDSRGARGTEVKEESWRRVMSEAVAAFGSDDDAARLVAALAGSRQRQATARARRLFLEGDLVGARQAAEEARGHLSTVRSRTVAWGLRWVPRPLLAVYLARKAVERLARRVAARRAGHVPVPEETPSARA